ncbi:MAG: HEAT repeat domain-containing protein [Acidobacteria bacterium]|nr:HEAT repeat domain-containing protein [Acidobacteriota bacterium]
MSEDECEPTGEPEPLNKDNPDCRKSEAAKQAVAELVAALKHDDCGVRWAAAEALGTSGDAHAVPALVAVLVDDDQFLRERVVKALDQIDPNWRQSEAATSAVPRFLASLVDRNQKRLVPRNPSEELQEMLCDRGTRNRISAAFALGEVRDPRAAEPLGEILVRGDEHRLLKQAAAHALSKIADTQAVEWLIRAIDLPYGSEEAAEALGQIDDARAFERLVVAAYKGGGAPVRRAAAEALSRIDPKWRECEAAKKLRPAFLND